MPSHIGVHPASAAAPVGVRFQQRLLTIVCALRRTLQMFLVSQLLGTCASLMSVPKRILIS